MNGPGVMGDALWSIALTAGLARMASALIPWPGAADGAHWSPRAQQHLAIRVRRGAIAALLVAAGVAGIMRYSPTWVQLPFWEAITALALAAAALVPLRPMTRKGWARGLRRVVRGAVVAQVATLGGALALMVAAIADPPLRAWSVVTSALMFLLWQSCELVAVAAREALTAMEAADVVQETAAIP